MNDKEKDQKQEEKKDHQEELDKDVDQRDMDPTEISKENFDQGD